MRGEFPISKPESCMTISSIKEATASKSRGFTLVELAVVIAIVALLLGALLVPLATQFQARNIRETQESLAHIKEALLGYAVTQGRLPCPDTDRDGLEEPCGGVGNIKDVVEGFVPWQDLGTPATDTWGRIFRYAVTREFTETAQPGTPTGDRQLDLADVANANISVVTRGDNAATPLPTVEGKWQIPLAANVPAVVLSVGSNGSGGSLLGSVDLPFATGPDELANVSAITSTWATPPLPARPFIQRLHTPPADPATCDETNEAQPFCEFDDLLIWISAPVLLNRMVEARQLP
jgi:prepilin-type N-terminal cleavage/methylation domain-containing protein